MVHYRHSYHAGNFADVFKHVLLVGLLDALNRKDKPWCFVDTHAGAGSYDLEADAAARTGEAQDGILRLREAGGAPPMVARYLEVVQAANAPGGWRRYPGSPALALALARPGDALVLCEKVPGVAAALKQNLRDPRVAVHLRDGYEAASLLPPVQKRGLLLADPPFERSDELEAVAGLIAGCAARFAGGIYAAWYPLKNAHAAGRFQRRLARDSGKPLLNLEFDNGAPPSGQMHACGLAVLNPPFGFEAAARTALEWLKPRLAQGGRAGFTISAL